MSSNRCIDKQICTSIDNRILDNRILLLILLDNRILLYVDNRILFSDEKKWDIKPQIDRERLECILLSERRQSEKATYFEIPTTWYSG